MLKPSATAPGRRVWSALLLCGLLAGPLQAAADDVQPAATNGAPATVAPSKPTRQQAREEAVARKAAAKQAKLEARQKAVAAKRKAAADRDWERKVKKLAAQSLKEGAAKARAEEAAQKKAEKKQAREKAAAEKTAAQTAKLEARQRAREEAAARKAAAGAAKVTATPPIQVNSAAEIQTAAAGMETPPVVTAATTPPAPPAVAQTRAEKTAQKKAEKKQAREKAAAEKAAAQTAKLEAQRRAREEAAAAKAAAVAARTEAQPVATLTEAPRPPTAPAKKGRAKPYVETAPKRGFHLFLRPKKKDPASQWEYVQKLEAANKTRKAAKQALALRIFYANSPEAPLAQLLYARLLERRHHPQEAFDAYQFLVEHYSGRFEFNEVIDRQMQIAKFLMERKKGKFLFLPGFAAPEHAIPLFEKIVASAPEGVHAAEAYYLTGVANERIYEYEKAIDAFFTTLNRFPTSEFAEKAAYSQAQCHIKISNDSPHDKRALDTAHAACVLYLQRYPDSTHRAEIQADLTRLRNLQILNAYALARYYDRILRKPAAALIEYESFVSLFPDAEQAPVARERIAQLKPSQPGSEE